MSNRSIIWSYVSCILYTIFKIIVFCIFLILQAFRFQKYRDWRMRSILKILSYFPTCSTCKSISFRDVSFNTFFNSSILFLADLEFQWPGSVIENLLFSSIIFKKQLAVSKEVTADDHFPSSERFIGGEKEKSFYLFVLFKFKCFLWFCSCLFN